MAQIVLNAELMNFFVGVANDLQREGVASNPECLVLCITTFFHLYGSQSGALESLNEIGEAVFAALQAEEAKPSKPEDETEH